MKLALITTTWRRPAITARVLAHHADAAPASWTLITTASPGDPEPVRFIDVPPRWVLRMAPNAPLGAKHNASLRAAEEAGCTHAVALTSATYLSRAYMLSVERIIGEGVDHGGCIDAMVYERDEATGKQVGEAWHWRGYARPPASLPPVLGTGRWFPTGRAAWPPSWERTLDNGLTHELSLAGVPRPKGYAMSELGEVVLTRGDVQITESDTYGARR